MEKINLQLELIQISLKYELDRIKSRNKSNVEWILTRRDFETSRINKKIDEINKKNTKNKKTQIERQLKRIEKADERFEHAYQYYYERDKASEKNAIESYTKKRDKLVNKLNLLEEI